MAPRTQESFVGPDRDPDRYRLLHDAGDGGEAELWKAEIEVAGKAMPVAVKILKPEHLGDAETWRDQWVKQVQVLRLLPGDPAVVGIHEAFEGPRRHARGDADPGDRALYLVMNWIEGPNLQDWVIQHTRLEDRIQAQRYLRQVARVLDWLHSGQALNGNPVFHCDITPANVIIDGNDQAVLVDWGLVRVAQHLTNAGRGTPHYTAPEAWRGQYSPASDRYSFGCLAYYVLTGTHPPLDPQQRRLGLTRIAGMSGQSASVEALERIFADDPNARPAAGEWLRLLRLQTTTAPVQALPMPPLAPGPGMPGLQPRPSGNGSNLQRHQHRRTVIVASASAAAVTALLVLAATTAFPLFRPAQGETGNSSGDGSLSAQESQVGDHVTQPATDPSPVPQAPTTGSAPTSPDTPQPSLWLAYEEPDREESPLGYAARWTTGERSVGGNVYHRSIITTVEECRWVMLGYNLDRRFERLEVTIGLADDAPSDVTARFEIRLDNELREGHDVSLGQHRDLVVDVSEVFRIELLVQARELDDGCYSPEYEAVWGSPRVYTTGDGR